MLRSAFDQFTHHVGNVNLLQGETPEEREQRRREHLAKTLVGG